MPTDEPQKTQSTQCLGFLTALDCSDEGIYGGYLVTNHAGRPLEFHCTAPIKPNRAQEILYGPTLEPYLYGEQIGRTLLTKAKVRPALVCTDRPASLCVDEFVDMPVALVLAKTETQTSETTEVGDNKILSAPNHGEKRWRLDPAHATEQRLHEFHLGRNHLAVSDRFAAKRNQLAKRLADVSETFDLAEPFGRIREAIEEARRGGR